MSRLRVRLVAVIGLAVTLTSGIASAQAAKAGLGGVVRTPSGNPAVSARVAVVNSSTGAIRSGVTDASGHYSVSDLTPGTYAVTVTLVGYRRLTRADVRIPNETTLDL